MPPTPAPIQKSTNPNPNHQTGNAALVNCTDELANASKWSVCSLEIRSTHTRSFPSSFAALSFLLLLPNNKFILNTYAASLTHPLFSSFFPLLFDSLSSSSSSSLIHSPTGWSDPCGWCLPPPFHTRYCCILYAGRGTVLPQPRAYFTQGLYPSHTGFSKDQTAGTIRSMDLASISLSPGRYASTPAPHYAWEACSWDFPRQRHQDVIDLLLSLVPLGRNISLFFWFFPVLVLLLLLLQKML